MMGMYTGLRFKAQLNEAGLAAVGAFYSRDCDWVNVAKDYDINGWERIDRCNFIPSGWPAYMPDDWENDSALEGGVWFVCCSLKNYEGEIETFLETVLPHWLAAPCACITLYEEDEQPTVTMVDPAARQIETTRRA